MRDLMELDFTKTIRDYDYTQRALDKISTVVNSGMFREMDSEAIFQYLMNEIEIVIFGDYLRRYLYKKGKYDIPFGEVSEKMYTDQIIEMFKANNAQFSLSPTSRKRGAIIKAWLNKKSQSREAVFTLGFGLGMSSQDVSKFLTKVIQEDDFDFCDVKEVIYWVCFNNKIGYDQALKLLQYYEESSCNQVADSEEWKRMRIMPKSFLRDWNNVLKYLDWMKAEQISEQRENGRMDAFGELYNDAIDIIRDIYMEEGADGEVKVSPADVEKMICCGIPVNGSGNLMNMSMSTLSEQFQQKRMTRQRIAGLFSGKIAVDRFDLITLTFFIYASVVEPDWPTERTIQFIEKINEVLESCQMAEIYPVNAYEAFVIMCMMTDSPLVAFADVWELSYE